MRVLLYAADIQGCGSHRVIWPGMAAAANPDMQICLGQAMNVAAQNKRPEVEFISQEVAAIKPHVIVFQRPMSIPLIKLMRELQRTGYAIVIDVDDDFTKLPESNPAFSNTADNTDPIQNRDNHRLACDFADLLTVSTDSIAESYGGGDRIHVLRNCVPEHWLKVRVPKDNPPALLWTGVYEYHAGDLEVADGQIGVAVSRSGAKFRHIGLGPQVEDAANVRGAYQPQGWLNLTEMQWGQAISRCTAGVVPLCDRPFNHGKSYIKGLEYAAFGLPFIASPMPEYKILHEMGAGELCEPKEWRDKVGRLLKDPDYRAERIKEGEQVASEQTHKKQSHLWVEAWEHAREIARSKIAA